MRALLTATLIASSLATAVQAADFRLYPGFRDRNALVEMTTDKGLIIEVVLRCSRDKQGRVKAGIMTYSKVERLYCSSKNRCFRNSDDAADNTCS